MVGSSALAGCSSVRDALGGGTHTGLGWLILVNHVSDSYALTVEVRSGDEVALDRTVDLEAATPGYVPSHEVACAWRDTDGPYSIRARHDRTEEWTTLDLTEDVSSEFPVGVYVEVGDAVREGDEVQFLFSVDEQPDCRAGEERR
jgi:hypothetical protein